jgi:hypothetical protein
VKTGGQRWQVREAGNQVAPRLALVRRHELPALGVLEELLALLEAEARELLEGLEAEGALLGPEGAIGAEGFLNLPPFGVRQDVERLLLFGGGEVEELVEAGGDLPALGFGQGLPLTNSCLELFRRASDMPSRRRRRCSSELPSSSEKWRMAASLSSNSFCTAGSSWSHIRRRASTRSRNSGESGPTGRGGWWPAGS